MSRIEKAFARLKQENRPAFIPFIMGGDPSPEKSAAILNALPGAGADIIELGIPFSDPMADGPVIQAAGLRALKAGTTLRKVLALAAGFRKQHPDVPLVLMGYLNPVFIYGYERFARDATAAGVDGIIIVDLPPEEAGEVEPLLSKNGIALIHLIAPTSVPDRVRQLTEHAQGYLYYISITGITGADAAPAKAIGDKLAAIRQQTTLPICVGFGVKTAEDVAALAKDADGVIVGSAIVKKIEASGGAVEPVAAFVRSLAEGCRR